MRRSRVPCNRLAIPHLFFAVGDLYIYDFALYDERHEDRRRVGRAEHPITIRRRINYRVFR